MKFKSIIFAATGLLALVDATTTVNNEGQVVTSSPSLTNIEARVQENSDAAHASPSQCYLNCHLPWEKCKKECGDAEQCGQSCNCRLFSDPKQMCRTRNCVEAPTNCPTSPLEGVEKLHDTNLQARAEDEEGLQTRAPLDACYDMCHVPWMDCMKECGDTKECDHLCNCFLFQNPKQMCRARNCVKSTGSCPPGMQGAVELPHDTAIQIRAEGDKDGQTAWVGPLIPKCAICEGRRDLCKQNCATPGACDDACNCYYKQSVSCEDCDVPCSCGHTCPHYEPPQRRMAIDEATHVDDAIVVSMDSNRPEDIHTAGAAPPPVSCVLCLASRNMSKHKCATPGACDDACNCYSKYNNRNCTNCKVPCDCGHACPRLEPLQRRMAIDETMEVGDARSASVASDRPAEDVQTAGPLGFPPRPSPPCLNCQPPPDQCTLCQISLNMCKQKCTTPRACDDSCNCWHKRNNPHCKDCSNIPCGCKTSCSRLEPLQRRTDIDQDGNDSLEPQSKPSAISDSAVNGPYSALMVPAPISGCPQCSLSIGTCQNKCATPGACDDACNCYFGPTRVCIECKIPCGCRHTCPRLALVQRRVITGPSTVGEVEDVNIAAETETVRAGVPNPCVVCRTGIKACKNKCNGDRKCENDCNCNFKNHTPRCKECSIPCNSSFRALLD